MVSDNSTVLVNRSSFSGNKAGHSGGVAYAYGKLPTAVTSPTIKQLTLEALCMEEQTAMLQ